MQPVGAVVFLVAQLVEHFLDLGEPQQPTHVVEVLVEDAACRCLSHFYRLGIGLEESLARLRLPGAQRRRERSVGRHRALAHLRRAARIAEGAQHPGDVAQRRVLAPRVGERPGGLALEVDNQEVVVRHQHLAEVVVAVVPGPQRALLRRCATIDEGHDLIGFPFQVGNQGNRLGSLLAHARAPGADVLGGERLGGERRIAGGGGESKVQLGGAKRERLHQRNEAAVALLRSLRLGEALQVIEGIAPGIALVGQVCLQQRHGRRLAFFRPVLDVAR